MIVIEHRDFPPRFHAILLNHGTAVFCSVQAYLKKRGAVEKLAGGVPLAEYIAAKRAELSALTGE